MLSGRLEYRPLTISDLDSFHSLVRDEYVRRYLMDGNLFAREWSEARVHESQALFERRGVGLWLVTDRTTHEVVGFCGFLEIPSIHPRAAAGLRHVRAFLRQGVRHRDGAHFNRSRAQSIGRLAGDRQRLMHPAIAKIDFLQRM